MRCSFRRPIAILLRLGLRNCWDIVLRRSYGYWNRPFLMKMISSIAILGKMLNAFRSNLIIFKAEVYSIFRYGRWGIGNWDPLNDGNLLISRLTTHLEDKQKHIKHSHEVCHNEWILVIGVINVTLVCDTGALSYKPMVHYWLYVSEAWH